ncbi:hypothetical protein DY000_02023832 [Brassica cretica]|uniref:Uncharacterized protein n=1 Tax=Brassica cretica TaxID=69181 RepID=A0ABQ7E6L3_BRACR|nr:hypothetical protein DY000_02023832 [Brassica cretica]
MEPNKVRIQELTLLFCGVNGLVNLTHLDEIDDVVTPNLRAIFSAHLVDLKKMPFMGKGQKKETVGSLPTPIFEYLGIRLDPSTADRSHRFLDEQHLMNSGSLKEDLLWSSRMGNQHRLLPMPNRMITDFDDQIDRLRFMPNPQLLRDLPAIPRRPPGVRRARATQGPPEAPLPDFPIIPDIPMRDQGDFQRVVVDVLHAIWARVSCTSRRTIRAHSPAAAGRSRQRRDPSPGSDDETSEDTT